MQPRLWAVLTTCLTVVAFAGCSSEPLYQFAPVEGTVRFRGEPLAQALVTFYPEADKGSPGPLSRGRTDENGHYTLQTSAGDEGAVIGTRRVCIQVMQQAEHDPNSPNGFRITPPDLTLPEALRNPFKTPFQGIQVKAGEPTHDFDVPEK